MKDLFQFAQRGLADHGYAGAIDGVIGPRSEAAIKRVHFLNRPDWNSERKTIAFAQFLLNKDTKIGELLVVDGILGPKTEKAFADYRAGEHVPEG